MSRPFIHSYAIDLLVFSLVLIEEDFQKDIFWKTWELEEETYLPETTFLAPPSKSVEKTFYCWGWALLY